MDQNYDHLYKSTFPFLFDNDPYSFNSNSGWGCFSWENVSLNSVISLCLRLKCRFLKGTLPKNQAPTIGVEFATKNVVLRNGGTVKA